jgi:hypothetical protein
VLGLDRGRDRDGVRGGGARVPPDRRSATLGLVYLPLAAGIIGPRLERSSLFNVAGRS